LCSALKCIDWSAVVWKLSFRMFGVRISVRTLRKFRGEVSPSETASTSVFVRVKQFKEGSVLNAVGERATVFRNVGHHLRFYRISQTARIQAPFSYTQSIWFSLTAAQTICSSKRNSVITVYQHCLTCHKVMYSVILRWICDFVADMPCMPAASSKINSKHFTSQSNSVLRASVKRNSCWLHGGPSSGDVACLT
jgi:hypothetical protein